MGGARGLLAAALAGLAVLGLAACADTDRPRPPAVAATSTTAAGPDGVRDRVVAWEAGRLDTDPRRLVVSFTGADPAADPADPCWEGYAPEVSAEPDRVVVRVRAYRSRTPPGPSSSATTWGSSAPWPWPCTTPWPAGRCWTATGGGTGWPRSRWSRAGCPAAGGWSRSLATPAPAAATAGSAATGPAPTPAGRPAG